MNKSELIEAIAASADLPKAAAGRALDAMVEAITGALQENDQVVLVGFGTFSVKERAARTGRNPQTGAPIEIAADHRQVQTDAAILGTFEGSRISKAWQV